MRPSDPRSRIGQSDGISRTCISTRVPSFLMATCSGTTILSLNLDRISFAISICPVYPSCSIRSIEGFPMVYPLAARKMFATTPTARTLSAIPFVRTCLATSIESSTFVPPRINVTGRGAPLNTRERFSTSRSIRSPAIAGSTSGRPTMVGWDRCAVPNASLMKRSPIRARFFTRTVFADSSPDSFRFSSALNRTFSSMMTSPAFAFRTASRAYEPKISSINLTSFPRSSDRR